MLEPILPSEILTIQLLMLDFHLQPVSWLSLGLLFMTGAGLIYYYDNEKKRLIDGKLIVLV